MEEEEEGLPLMVDTESSEKSTISDLKGSIMIRGPDGKLLYGIYI
jgi:hypothetical protein